MSSGIPVSKSVDQGQENQFTGFTAVGVTADEIAYSKIPEIKAFGKWIFVVPYYATPPKKSGAKTIVLPDSSKERSATYIVIGVGGDKDISVKFGDVVKIVDVGKRKLDLESGLVKRYLGLSVYSIQQDSIMWVLSDEEVMQLV